jgi:hypothetical protein
MNQKGPLLSDPLPVKIVWDEIQPRHCQLRVFRLPQELRKRTQLQYRNLIWREKTSDRGWLAEAFSARRFFGGRARRQGATFPPKDT